MSSNKINARITGILFITATAASILSLPFLEPLNASNYLAKLSSNQDSVLVGVLFIIIGAAASVSIAVSLYPLLKKYNGGLALGAVAFRLIEAMLGIVGAIGIILLLNLSPQFVKAGAPTSSYFQTLGSVTIAGYHWVEYAGLPLAFCLGAMMYYIVFYRSRLIPRWLSGWGIVGVTLGIAAALLVMFNLISPLSTVQLVLNLPFIGAQEMVLAAWLIIKGFNSSAITSSLPGANSQLHD